MFVDLSIPLELFNARRPSMMEKFLVPKLRPTGKNRQQSTITKKHQNEGEGEGRIHVVVYSCINYRWANLELLFCSQPLSGSSSEGLATDKTGTTGSGRMGGEGFLA